jgi:hypothetical protein
MPNDTAEPAPTSSATTRQTEPEVVAGIASAEGVVSLAARTRNGRSGNALVRGLIVLAASAAAGYGTARWLRSSD